MDSKNQERTLVSSDYFFWFLTGVVACFATFSFFSFKTWQASLFFFFAILFFSVSSLPHRRLMVSFLFGVSVSYLRLAFWDGDVFQVSLPAGFLNFLEFISQRFSAALVKLFPEPVAGFSRGIILGGQGVKFDDSFWQALKITSTAHVIAVSGFNITLIARGISNFLSFLTLHRKLIWIFASLAVVVFIDLVVAPASAWRAGIISILMLVADRFSRQSSTKIAFAFALALMSFLNPIALKNDLGFQLSFLASFGIFYIAPKLLGKKQAFSRVQDSENKPNWFKQTAFETLAAQAMVFPLLIYKFGTLSLTGSLANLIILPLIPLAMGLSFSSGLAMIIFEPLGRIIGFVSYPFLSFIVGTIEFFAGLPFAGVNGVFISPLFLVICYAALGFVFISMEKRNV